MHSNTSIPADNIQQSCLCVKCEGILREPYQTTCGCRICKECAAKCLEGRESTECPGNTEDCKLISWSSGHFKIIPDRAVLREIANLKVKCGYFSRGCEEIMFYRDFDSHSSVCEYRIVVCSACNREFPQREYTTHVLQCPKTKEECLKCQNSFTREDLAQIHNNLQFDNCCEFLETACPNCHAGMFNKLTIKRHYDECPNKDQWIFPCTFEHLGCQFRASKALILQHSISDSSQHLNLAIAAIKQQNCLIEELAIGLVDAQSQFEDLKDNFNYCKKLVTKSQMETADLLFRNQTQSFDSMDGGYRSSSSSESNVFESIEEVLRQPIGHKGPQFVWKIKNYKSYLQRSQSGGLVSIFSPPMYSSEFGYKICLRAYPNGDGSGKNEYLSLFIMILEGEYDDIQVWPFNKLVNLTLIGHSGHRNVSEKFRAENTSPCFQQPKTRRYNTATGCPRFIHKTRLTSTNAYMSDANNGTLFIQAKFE